MDGLLTVQGVGKSYGNVRALDQVTTTFRCGEVHAVLGENGAGKSTLMGILAGFVTPDSGSVEINGSALPVGKPFAVRELGIKMVHQHFMLVPQLTVLENLALSQLEGGLGQIPFRQVGDAASGLARGLGWEVDLAARAADLAVGAQQRVEILKALLGKSQVLILDEPTAVLSPEEAEDLFHVLRQLKKEGKMIILIAHKLSEVMAVADRVTVLRRGNLVASCPIVETNPGQLAEWMVGEVPVPEQKQRIGLGGLAVNVNEARVNDDRGALAVDRVTFRVCSGEVFGIGGVDGNGQVELAEVLAGIRAAESGVIDIPGKVAYIPQDRQQDGLALNLSIEENFLIGGIPAEVASGPFLSPKRSRGYADKLIEQYQVKAASPAEPASSLSGGNQQKVVVARTLSREPDVVVAVNPTRGLDIRATAYVHERLRQATSRGAAVILVSTDLDELAALADRTQFMSRGRLGDHFLGESE